MQEGDLIIITGLSGSGKSTLGERLANHLSSPTRRVTHIDEDDFYFHPSTFPTAKYEGKNVRIWDHESCVDFDRMCHNVVEALKSRLVILTGFFLPPHVMFPILEVVTPAVYIVLNIPPEVSLQRRAVSKGSRKAPSGIAPPSPSSGWNLDKDKWMMEKFIYPFYEVGQTLLRESESSKKWKIETIDGTLPGDRVFEIATSFITA
jgi:thymidylate kinase